MKRAFLSGLGVMGRRHLLGLLRAGFHTIAVDPRKESVDSAVRVIEKAGEGNGNFHWSAEIPVGDFDVAIFSETAPYRLENLKRFLESARASKILLEKPLTANPFELAVYEEVLAMNRVAIETVSVNLSRRTWPLFVKIKPLCESSSRLTLTANGGAVGFGSNGIHFIDVFLFLSGYASTRVSYSQVSTTEVASGRGSEFSDFGGSFLIENEKSSFFCSLSAESSAPPIFVVSGEHFVAWLDEGDLRYRIEKRATDSHKPNYLCGHDYKVMDEGIMSLMPFDQLTENWASSNCQLPNFHAALQAHNILFAILEAAGRRPPYRFT